MPGITNHFSEQEVAVLQADQQVAALASAQNWPALVTYLSEPASTRARLVISKGEMLRGLLPAVMRLPSRTDAEQRQWDRFLDVVRSTDTITLTDAGVQVAIAAGIASGLLTQPEADRILLQPASRIEGMLGREIPYVTAEDLQAVLGG